MIMKRLIGMTDFVLAETKLWSGNENESYEIAKSCLKYAQFLKQPLELWMFVPCDENGNVLEEPKVPHTFASENSDLYIEKWNKENELYQKAKERCLFDGVEYIEAKKEGNFSFLRITELSTINYPNFWNGHTIEDLVKYNLELTPTAIKTLWL